MANEELDRDEEPLDDEEALDDEEFDPFSEDLELVFEPPDHEEPDHGEEPPADTIDIVVREPHSADWHATPGWEGGVVHYATTRVRLSLAAAWSLIESI